MKESSYFTTAALTAIMVIDNTTRNHLVFSEFINFVAIVAVDGYEIVMSVYRG